VLKLASVKASQTYLNASFKQFLVSIKGVDMEPVASIRTNVFAIFLSLNSHLFNARIILRALSAEGSAFFFSRASAIDLISSFAYANS